MRIFDCFIYYDEDLILDIRLRELNKFIHKFIIVESGEDHQGNPKKKNFNIRNFEEFKSKIEYYYFEKFPEFIKEPWKRENYQRDYLINGLKDAQSEDLIIVSDVDEIPNLNFFLKKGDFNNYYVFEQKMFYYKLNLQSKTNPVWHGSKACKKKYLKGTHWLRSLKSKKYPFWRLDKIKFKVIADGGWHFSFLKNSHDIKKKLESYAHTEYNNPYFTNLDHINYSIDNKKDLFNRNINYEKKNIDSSFPEYIRNNKDFFKDWIL
jgi:beta-1,4-mannosyl-glycoprotein beta-1,4-N-acetylglucosaminyltransferase